MRICQVHPNCGIQIPPPAWGAIEKIIWEFKCNLEKLGHTVDIKFEAEVESGEHIWHNKYDIVMVHVANLANKLHARNIPYIFQFHDHHAVYHGKDSQVYKENLQAMENSLVSLVPARYLVNYFNTDKVEYFSHGVNTDFFVPREEPLEEHRLLCVANNGMGGYGSHDRKGFGLAIAIAAQRGLPITIAGPWNNRNFFNDNPWTLMYPKLSIMFEPNQTDLLKLYQDHTIFMHPSEMEAGHPNLTILEAASCGVPVNGWIEMETDFFGMWRASRDFYELLRGVDDIIDNYDSYRQKARQHAKSLSWFNRSEELLKIYERYIN